MCSRILTSNMQKVNGFMGHSSCSIVADVLIKCAVSIPKYHLLFSDSTGGQSALGPESVTAGIHALYFWFAHISSTFCIVSSSVGKKCTSCIRHKIQVIYHVTNASALICTDKLQISLSSPFVLNMRKSR